MIQHYRELFHLHRRLVLRGASTAGMLTLLLSLIFLVASPSYKAEVVVTMEPSDVSLRFNQSFRGVSQFNPATIIAQSHIERLISRPVLERAVEILQANGVGPTEKPNTLDLVKGFVWRTWTTLNYGSFIEPTEEQEILDTFSQAVSIELVEGSYILIIEVVHEYPKIAARAANALVQAYSELASEGLGLGAQRINAEVDAVVRRRLADERSLISEQIAINDRIGSATIAEERELRLSALASARQRLARGNVAEGRQLTDLRNEVAQAEEVLKTLDRDAVRLIQIDTALERVRTDLTAISDQILGLDLARAASLSQVRVVNPANAPLYPSFPKVFIFVVIAMIVGAILAALPVIILDLLDKQIRTRSDLEMIVGSRALPNLPAWRKWPFRHVTRLRQREFADAFNLRVNMLGYTAGASVSVMAVSGDATAENYIQAVHCAFDIAGLDAPNLASRPTLTASPGLQALDEPHLLVVMQPGELDQSTLLVISEKFANSVEAPLVTIFSGDQFVPERIGTGSSQTVTVAQIGPQL